MDQGIAALSAPSSINAVSVAVARKAQDAARDEGAAMVSLIRAAAEATNGRGASEAPAVAPGSLDLYA